MISISNIWGGFREIGADVRMFHFLPMVVYCDQSGVKSLQIGWLIWIVYIGARPVDEARRFDVIEPE